jgi:multicomponent Na+:H+ antiporter subunit E
MTLWQRLAANAAFAVALLAVWYILSGKFDVVHFGAGVVASIAIAATIPRVDDGTRLHWGRTLVFLPWLLVEIVRSNLQVARLVLSPRRGAAPRLVQFTPPFDGTRARAIYGIATNLTPGTLTVEVDGEAIQVHVLDGDAAEALKSGPMVGRVAALFREVRA